MRRTLEGPHSSFSLPVLQRDTCFLNFEIVVFKFLFFQKKKNPVFFFLQMFFIFQSFQFFSIFNLKVLVQKDDD